MGWNDRVYLSGTVTAGIGFVGSGANGRGRDSVIAIRAGAVCALAQLPEPPMSKTGAKLCQEEADEA